MGTVPDQWVLNIRTALAVCDVVVVKAVVVEVAVVGVVVVVVGIVVVEIVVVIIGASVYSGWSDS